MSAQKRIFLDEFQKNFAITIPTAELLEKYLGKMRWGINDVDWEWVKAPRNSGWVYRALRRSIDGNEVFEPVTHSYSAELRLLLVPLDDDGQPDIDWMYALSAFGVRMRAGKWSISTKDIKRIDFLVDNGEPGNNDFYVIPTPDGLLMYEAVPDFSFSDVLSYAPIYDFTPDIYGVAQDVDGEPVYMTLPDYASCYPILSDIRLKILSAFTTITTIPGEAFIAHGLPGVKSLFVAALNGTNNPKSNANIFMAPQFVPQTPFIPAQPDGEPFPCCSLYCGDIPIKLSSLPLYTGTLKVSDLRFDAPAEDADCKIEGMWYRGILYLLCPVFYAETKEELLNFLQMGKDDGPAN